MKGKHFKGKQKNARIKNRRGRKQNIHIKKLINKLLLIISILVFLICLCILVFWLYSNNELERIEKNLSQLVTDATNDGNIENQSASLKIDFKELKAINSDVIGWIYIKDTDINYPILQTTDNEYYLKKSIYKTYSSCGSIFLDCNTKPDFSEQNTVVYGHNLKNQKMFADLAKIYRGELGEKIKVEIYTENTFEEYTIFACYMEEPNTNVIQKNWNKKEKKDFINKAIEKSSVKFSCDIEYDKKILTLITCDSTGKERIIVHAI